MNTQHRRLCGCDVEERSVAGLLYGVIVQCCSVVRCTVLLYGVVVKC